MFIFHVIVLLHKSSCSRTLKNFKFNIAHVHSNILYAFKNLKLGYIQGSVDSDVPQGVLTLIREILGPSPRAISGKNPKHRNINELM